MQKKANKNKSAQKQTGKISMKRWINKKSVRNFILFLEAMLVVVFLTHPDLYYDGTAASIPMRFYADSLTICGGLWVILVFLTVKEINLSEKVNRILTWVTGFTFPFLCFLWLELYNHMQFWVPIFHVKPIYFVLDLAIYYVIYLLLLLLINSVKYASVVMMVLTAFFGIANWELTIFRSMSFIASDIYSFLTAVSVANTYRPQLDVDTAEFFMLAMVVIALLFKLDRIRLFRWKGRLVYLALCIAMSVGFVNVYVYSDYLENIGVDFRVYRPQNKYRFYGTLLTTARTFGYLHVSEPDGYSLEAVNDIIENSSLSTGKDVTETESTEGADNTNAAGSGSSGDASSGSTADTGNVVSGNETATDNTAASESTEDTAGTGTEQTDAVIETPEAVKDENPNVIVVMNESFADLGEVGDLSVSEDYMPYFRSLKKNVVKGYAYSSVFGGNTANSEFEFLTGNTMAFLPDNSVPYQLFLRQNIPGLTSSLKSQGYSNALALHPYYNTGYSRYKIYPLMGFDKFYTSDDFSVFTETVNYHITDYEDYRKVISLYEESKQNSDDPFYLFNVTMQNHGSYNGNTYETGDQVQLKGQFQFNYKVEQYLNMIKMSDDALKYLIQYFQEVDEPTVIVFFGDHQPDFDESFYSALTGQDISTIEGEDLETLYKVPFLIWANYDIGTTTVEKTSLNYLSTYLAEVAGLQKTGYQEFLTSLRTQIPAINAYGYWDQEGTFYEVDDETSPYYSLIHQYNLLEYNDIFGKEERVDSFFYQDEEDASEEVSTEEQPDQVYGR